MVSAQSGGRLSDWTPNICLSRRSQQRMEARTFTDLRIDETMAAALFGDKRPGSIPLDANLKLAFLRCCNSRLPTSYAILSTDGSMEVLVQPSPAVTAV